MKLRVIGDEPTILQALLASNIDGAVITYASAAVAKRAGFVHWRIRPIFQSALSRRDSLHAERPDYELSGSHHASGKGMVEGVAFIHDPRNKRDVMAVLKKNLRLSTDEDAETSYNTLRMVSSLDVAPDPEAWKNIQRLVRERIPRSPSWISIRSSMAVS